MADPEDSDSDFDINKRKPYKQIIESDAESSSGSSIGEPKMCSICLTDIGRQDLSSPNSCSHSFCLNCLTQWAKTAKTCPIDRLKFTLIIVRNSRGHVLQEIDICNNEEYNKETFDTEDLTYCEVCHLCNREDEMLLCDICDSGYHMDCINPPLFQVPMEEWYCPQCNERGREEDGEDEEQIGLALLNVLNNINEERMFNLSRRRLSRIREPRLVPRTRAAERVRMHTRRIQDLIDDGEILEQSTSNRKKQKKNSKRNTRVKKSSKKRNKIRKKNTNLSERLGLCSSRENRNSTGNAGSMGASTSFVDHTSLSLFGSRHELDYVADWSDGEHEVGGDGSLQMVSMPRIRVSTADLVLRKEISEIARRPVHRSINVSLNIDSINIMDTIMNIQENEFKKKPTDNVDKHITQTPMYSDRTDKNSDNFNNYSSNRNNNRSYPKNNDRSYSDAGNSSTYGESHLTNEQNFSENQPVNPFPYRNSGPIKFRMNVTKMGERKQPQTPPKVVTTEYNVEGSGPSTQTEETFKALEPPPEPPALLLGINLDEDDADNLVIDDKDYYDPENPSDGDDEDTAEVSRPTAVAGYMQSPTYGGYMEQVENRSIPIIPVTNSSNILRPDDDIVSSEEEEKEINDDCPNIALYSSTSLKLSSSPKEYGPILEDEATKSDKLSGDAELQFIPMPPVSPERNSQSGQEESPKSEEVLLLESIEVNDNDDKSQNVDNSDNDDNKFNSDDDVNDVINEVNLECEKESFETEKIEQLDFEIDTVAELNDSTDINKENQSLLGGATWSEVSCATLICSDNDNQQKETVDLNFDPISDSEDEKQKDDGSSDESEKREELSNGKSEVTVKHNDNKDKAKKPIVKEKETVPWKKLSKPSKDRNYRYGKGKEKIGEENVRKEKKQKRKEIELYDVRKVLEDRPRRKKDKFGRDLSKSSNSDSGSKDRGRRKKRKRSRSKQRKRSVSSGKPKSRKRSKSRYRSESKNRYRSKSRHRSRSTHRSRSSKRLSRYDKGQVNITKERYRSPSLFDDRDMSPLLSKRQAKKSKEKASIYSKIEKDYERKLLKNQKSSKKKIKKKSKDYQFSSLSPRSLSPGMQVWQSPREQNLSPWSHTDISRTPSPVYSRHTTDMEMNYSNRDQEFSEYNDNNMGLNNLTVIVKNDSLKKSKLSKRHKRQISGPPVKEVFASGDNIMVSVNFNKDNVDEQILQEPLKRKRQETVLALTKKSKNSVAAAIPDTTSTNHKTTTLKRTQNPKWQNRRNIVRTIEGMNAKPVAIIDLNTSPFREIEMSPKSIIVLTDSDEDKQVSKLETKKDNSPEKSKENIVDEQKPVEKNENSTQTITTITIGGPKTPPEPVNVISKPDNISNNSCEFNSQDEDHTQSHDVRGRGPNTPPEPPRSVDTIASETAYDPFEPTKSNSPSPPPRIDMFEDDDDVDHHDHSDHDDDRDDNNVNVNDENDKNDNDDNNHHNDTPTQPLEENKTVDSQLAISPLRNIAKTITPPFLESQNTSQIDKTPEKLVTNVASNPSLYTSPIKVAKTPSPKQLTPTATNADEIINLDDNDDDSPTTAFDNVANSPYSPSEGFVDEMKGSSPVSPIPPPKNSVSTTSQSHNKNETRSKLDTLLSILPRVTKSSNNNFDNIAKLTNLKPIKMPASKTAKHFKQTTINEDGDDLPGSAVELESKNKFLEKLNRQERVIEEVKHVLKPHYNKKHITKEQYKDIMRKAVPKICHNKSGEINPQKIHSLIEAYVIKYRHSHRKQVQRLSNK